MRQQAMIRYGVAAAILMIVFTLYVGLHPRSLTLLTPPPGPFVAVTILVVCGLALFAGYVLARDIPSRLARRVILLLVLAFTIYAGGESARGLYATMAFDEPGRAETQRWMAIGGHGDTVTLSSPTYRRTLVLPASAEAAATAQPGQCVNVSVQTSSSGAQRVAPSQAPVQVTDFSPC